MKRAPFIVLCLVAASCTSAFDRVKGAHTIDEARALLKGAEPTVTAYPPNAEAWYFGKNECVLFVDGKVRLSKSTATEVEGGHTKPSMVNSVLCAPSALDSR